jgi:energy-coupling factor transport system permease protein
MNERLPRPLHPIAWWLWALGMATAASRTTNPILLLLIVTVLAGVVTMRRSDAPWAKGFRSYVVLALVVIAIRVLFRVLLDGQYGSTVLFRLPELHMPAAAAGIRIGGPVSLEGILAALYDGMRLGTLLMCIGAANVLADPKRLLKSLPSALHEVGVAATVALTVAPQLIESRQRIRRARRLRGVEARRRRLVHGMLIPVLEDALDRSLVLAAAMDSRGYGRHGAEPRRARIVSGGLVLVGVIGVGVGAYGMLDGSTARGLGAPVLAGGCAVAAAGLVLGGRRVRRSVYRPDPWRGAEWAVVVCGALTAALVFMASRVDPENLYPSLQPLRWPNVSPLPVLAVLVGFLPAYLAPPVALRPDIRPVELAVSES